MRPLVLLRPEPGLAASAARARALGLTVIEAPLFAIEPVEWTLPSSAPFDALLLTSANAVRHGGPAMATLRHLPVHAVGEATAAAAADEGFTVATVGTSGVGALTDLVPHAQRLLWLAGADRADPGREGLTAVTVYRAVPTSAPLPPLGETVVAVHSPRAARRLAMLAGPSPRCRIAAISAAAANAAGGGWEAVEIAPEPSDSSLLALAARLCHTTPR